MQETSLLFKTEEEVFKIAKKLEEKDIFFTVEQIENFYELTFYKEDIGIINRFLLKYNIEYVEYNKI